MAVVPSEYCLGLCIPDFPATYQVYCKYWQISSLSICPLANLFCFSHLALKELSYLQGKRNKKLFWLPAIAPLISVLLSTLIVFLTKADKHGVKIVKHIKGGLNPSSAHQLQLGGPHVGQAAKAGLISAVIALAVSYPLLSLYISS